MSRLTIGTTTEASPASDFPSRVPGTANTAEQRVRALAPTVYCPSTRVEQCLGLTREGLTQ